MFADIVPTVRLPRHLLHFTYAVPDALVDVLTVGHVVTVPFRNRPTIGVVTALHQQLPAGLPAKQIKSLNGLAADEPLVTADQLALADWLANHYASSLGLVIKILVPAIPKNKQQLRRRTVPLAPYTATPAPTSPGQLLWYRSVNQKDNWLAGLLEQDKQESNGQTLLLVPTMQALTSAGRYLSPAVRQQTVFVGGEKNKTEELADWRAVLTGQAKYIVGTRAAVFMPFQQLQHIIVDDEYDDSFKQWDQNPRYDARAAAGWLAAKHACALTVTTPAPRVATYAAWQDRGITKSDTTPLAVKLIDRRAELRGGMTEQLSDRTLAAMTETLTAQQSVFLFINRRGVARAAVCGDCGHTPSCPSCLLPLAVHQEQLQCHHCRYQTAMPTQCPRCHGTDFKFPGSGSQSLETFVRQQFPDHPVVRIDADTTTAPTPTATEPTIFIGTELAIDQLPWQQIGMTAITSADNLLSVPSFSANEKAWILLSRLRAAAQASSQQPLHLQTYAADHSLLQHWTIYDDDWFYQQELTSRQELAYPPYGRLTNIICQASSAATAERDSQQVYQALTKIKKESKIEATIIAPQAIYTQQLRGRYRRVIIIKHQQPIATLLAAVPTSCIIDVDPIELL